MFRFLSRFLFLVLISVGISAAPATTPESPLDIHFIWFGGNDCPPCVAWRQTELPKLEQSPEFKAIRFSFVIKTVGSPIPLRIFLPAEVAPLKEKLDEASGGRSGSPKGALVVNGEIYDFFQGTRSAAQIEKMIRAVRTNSRYPFKRCLKAAHDSRACIVFA